MKITVTDIVSGDEKHIDTSILKGKALIDMIHYFYWDNKDIPTICNWTVRQRVLKFNFERNTITTQNPGMKVDTGCEIKCINANTNANGYVIVLKT